MVLFSTISVDVILFGTSVRNFLDESCKWNVGYLDLAEAIEYLWVSVLVPFGLRFKELCWLSKIF